MSTHQPEYLPGATSASASASAPAIELQRDLYYVAVQDLCSRLPPPIENTPEGWARRDRVAIATVACLLPGNAAETSLAAHHVAAMAHASAALRGAVHDAADPTEAARHRAQAASMGREARGFLAKLLQAQAARTKREANPTARDSAAMAEHCTFALLNDALQSLPPPAAAVPPPAPAAALPKPPSATRRLAAAAPPPAKPAKTPRRNCDDLSDAAKQQTNGRWKAERYAGNYPRRARLIRLHKGLPPGGDFAPPEPDLLHAIITGTGQRRVEKDALDPNAA